MIIEICEMHSGGINDVPREVGGLDVPIGFDRKGRQTGSSTDSDQQRALIVVIHEEGKLGKTDPSGNFPVIISLKLSIGEKRFPTGPFGGKLNTVVSPDSTLSFAKRIRPSAQ